MNLCLSVFKSVEFVISSQLIIVKPDYLEHEKQIGKKGSFENWHLRVAEKAISLNPAIYGKMASLGFLYLLSFYEAFLRFSSNGIVKVSPNSWTCLFSNFVLLDTLWHFCILILLVLSYFEPKKFVRPAKFRFYGKHSNAQKADKGCEKLGQSALIFWCQICFSGEHWE